MSLLNLNTRALNCETMSKLLVYNDNKRPYPSHTTVKSSNPKLDRVTILLKNILISFLTNSHYTPDQIRCFCQIGALESFSEFKVSIQNDDISICRMLAVVPFDFYFIFYRTLLSASGQLSPEIGTAGNAVIHTQNK